jgi:alcohol dehydrogenase class IV
VTAPYFVRQATWRLKLTLAKVLIGDKDNSSHFAFAGPASSERLCNRITEAGHTRLLIVTDKPLRDLGIVDKALVGFGQHRVELAWYDGVIPDPGFTQVQEGAEVYRANQCTAILAVGGGSSIDAAKVIALAVANAGNPKDWVGMNKAPDTGAPVFAMPTTAGTGSEATMGAVITDEADHSKNIIAGPALLPTAVALDPQLMQGLPAAITAATGLDALTHGIEAFLSVWDRGSRTETALMAIKGVFRWLPVALAEPDNIEAREGMALAAYYGGVAINQVSVGNVHAIAHQLGARYGIAHGMANAMVLPSVLRAYGSLVEAPLSTLAQAIELPEPTASAFISAVEKLRDDSGLPAQHAAIVGSDVSGLVDAALSEGDGYFSPRLFMPEEFRHIIESLIVA